MPATLAEVALEERLLGAEELAMAAKTANQLGVPLVVALVREHAIDEVALVVALKKHIQVPVPDPDKLDLDSDALGELHPNECRRLRAIPTTLRLFDKGRRELVVAMADPTDAVTIAELQELTGCSIETELVTLSAVEEMIEVAYKHAVTQVMKRGHVTEERREQKPTELGRGKQGSTRPKSKTTPFHRISSEASVSLQVEALVRLCIEKGVFGQHEYDALLTSLLKKQNT